MKYVIIAVAILMLATTQAQSYQEPYPPLDPVAGVAMIGWENDIGADMVIVWIERDDCPIAAHGAPDDTGDPQQAITQVPAGPPFDERCLLRPGDHVYLQRWRDGEHIDTIGPYVVPVRVWLPVVVR